MTLKRWHAERPIQNILFMAKNNWTAFMQHHSKSLVDIIIIKFLTFQKDYWHLKDGALKSKVGVFSMFTRCSDNIWYLSGATGLHRMEAFDQKSTRCASFVQRSHTIRLRSEVTTDLKTPLFPFKQLKQREKAAENTSALPGWEPMHSPLQQPRLTHSDKHLCYWTKSSKSLLPTIKSEAPIHGKTHAHMGAKAHGKTGPSHVLQRNGTTCLKTVIMTGPGCMRWLSCLVEHRLGTQGPITHTKNMEWGFLRSKLVCF